VPQKLEAQGKEGEKRERKGMKTTPKKLKENEVGS